MRFRPGLPALPAASPHKPEARVLAATLCGMLASSFSGAAVGRSADMPPPAGAPDRAPVKALAALLAPAPPVKKSSAAAGAGAMEMPGLSAALSARPPYKCVINKYIDANNGDDHNDGGTIKTAWKTIQNADDGYPNHPVPGECINVLPGTYTLSRGLIVGNGGNTNSPVGFVVYRSEKPQQARILVNYKNGNMVAVTAPYVVIDGFELDGNHAMTTGNAIDGCTSGGAYGHNVAHHLMVLNNIIHDVGGSGIDMCIADYAVWKHNIVYNTSSSNIYQVSGINIGIPFQLTAVNALPSQEGTRAGLYMPTPADKVRFGIVIAYNIVHDNAEGPRLQPAQGCAPFNGGCQHTDGNGIIIDTTLGNGKPYLGRILVAGNVAYNNGGGGIHVFNSENIVVANNTAYGNYRDAFNPGTTRGEFSNGGSANVTWVNNLAYAAPGQGANAHNVPFSTFATSSPDSHGVFANNLSFGAANALDSENVFDTATNLINVDPKLTDPAAFDFRPSPGSPVIGAGKPVDGLAGPHLNIGAY